MRQTERGAASTTVVITVFAALAVVAILFLIATIVFTLPAQDEPDPAAAAPVAEPERAAPAPMPVRTRAREELDRAARERATTEVKLEPGPIPGWTQEESLAAVEEALQDLLSYNDETDPHDIAIAVQRLVEQLDLAVPAIQRGLATPNDTLGDGISITDDRMETFPDRHVALMEALRRIDTESSRAVLAQLLSNAETAERAGFAIWMLQHTSSDAREVSSALRLAATRLLGDEFQGTDEFQELLPSRWLLDALRQEPVDAAVAGLARLSRDLDDRFLAREASRALAATGTLEAVSAVLALHEDEENARGRNETARLLGSMHGPAVLQTLRDRVLDSGIPESERAALVAGVADYAGIVDPVSRLSMLQSGKASAEEITRELERSTRDLDDRIALLQEAASAYGPTTSPGVHAELAIKRLEELRTRLLQTAHEN